MQTQLRQLAEQRLCSLFTDHSIPFDLQYSASIEPLVRAVMLSDFVYETLQKQPELLNLWITQPPTLNLYPDYRQHLAQILAPIEEEEAFHCELRRFRHRELATLSYLQSNYPHAVQTIFERLSDLAESLILGARDWLFTQLCRAYGTPKNAQGETQELVILGMGKLGGRELNFSSDIDLIFTYPEQGETVGGRKALENSKFFTRLGQRLIQALDQMTVDGFVYRTDMRLRPFGESGALVLSFNAMEEYYQEQGRDWERYAMIKAKILGDDPHNPYHFALKQLLRPFVYRRYLDFSAIQSLRDMKQKIRREVLRRGLEDNIKLGAGGIREIEFIVQSFQMMRGGRDTILRQRELLAVLPHLHTLNLLSAEQVSQLREAYLFLRLVENSLQAIADQQTQTLPTQPEQQARLIHMAHAYVQPEYGVEVMTWADFLAVLSAYQQPVSAIFRELIGEDEGAEVRDEPYTEWEDCLQAGLNEADLTQCLARYALSSQDYPEIVRLLSERWQEWLKRSIGVRGREVLRRLLPRVADHIFQHTDYLTLLPRILTIVDKITTRTTYLELLLEKEQILPQLCQLCAQSTMIAEQIARYPILLDELIVPKSLMTMLPLSDYPRALHEYLLRIPQEDEEALIDGLRQFKQSHLLRIATADLLGVLPVMKISDHLTYLAEAMIGAVVNMAWKSLSARYGRPEHLIEGEQDFVVIGYGKLGGIELGYHSDLDLVFLHNAPAESETVGGKKTISAHQFYLKLAQKINSIFNLNTSVGTLYEIDMRLRPSGEAGLLVSSFEAYADYQQNEAWTWETQALVRARAVYGEAELRQKFEQIRQTTLSQPRTSTQLADEICKMREKMYVHTTQHDPDRFQLKTDRGGITDIEFIAQYLVLNYASYYPIMASWSDNVRIFESCAECGVLPAEQAEALKQSYITLRNQIHHLNLLNQPAEVSRAEFIEIRGIVESCWNSVFGSQQGREG